MSDAKRPRHGRRGVISGLLGQSATLIGLLAVVPEETLNAIPPETFFYLVLLLGAATAVTAAVASLLPVISDWAADQREKNGNLTASRDLWFRILQHLGSVALLASVACASSPPGQPGRAASLAVPERAAAVRSISPECQSGPFFDPAAGAPLDLTGGVLRLCPPTERGAPGAPPVALGPGDLAGCRLVVADAAGGVPVSVQPVEPGQLVSVALSGFTGPRTISGLACDAADGTAGLEVPPFAATFRAPGPPAAPALLP